MSAESSPESKLPKHVERSGLPGEQVTTGTSLSKLSDASSTQQGLNTGFPDSGLHGIVERTTSQSNEHSTEPARGEVVVTTNSVGSAEDSPRDVVQKNQGETPSAEEPPRDAGGGKVPPPPTPPGGAIAMPSDDDPRERLFPKSTDTFFVEPDPTGAVEKRLSEERRTDSSPSAEPLPTENLMVDEIGEQSEVLPPLDVPRQVRRGDVSKGKIQMVVGKMGDGKVVDGVSTTFDSLGDTLKPVIDKLTESHMRNTVEAGYVIPQLSGAAVTQPRENQGVGIPEYERTPVDVLHRIARDPQLKAIDDRIDSIVIPFGAGAPARAEVNSLTEVALTGILWNFGVHPGEITFVPEMRTAWFPYKDRYVHISTTEGVTNIVAWDKRLSEEKRGRVWDDHSRMEKDGSSVARLHLALQRGELPPYLEAMREQIMRDTPDIAGAFNEHVQALYAHAARFGFTQFQVHSRAGLRLAVPVALYLLEQPFDTTHALVGDYSVTMGHIGVDEPGRFRRVRTPKLPNPQEVWEVTENGGINKIR